MSEDKNELKQLQERVYDYVKLSMGDGMITIDLDPAHYQNCLTRAIEVFRTRSSAAVEESFLFLTIQNDTQFYTLPDEVQTVIKIWRRSMGDLGQGGSQFDPFMGGWMNVYILNASSPSGGALSWSLFQDYNAMMYKLFGGEIDFNFNSVTKKLTVFRQPRATGEGMLLQIYNWLPEVQLLSNVRTLSFIKEYTLALAKLTEGEAREKFGSVPGPSGGTSLNGAAIKAEGRAMIDKLHEDITNFRFGEEPLGFIIG